jgi:putative lipoprotein
MCDAVWNLARKFILADFGAFIALLAGCATTASEPSSSGTPILLTGVLTGTASYRERIALPLGSIVRVTLEDATGGDTPKVVVASTTVVTERQAPIPFALAYDPTRIVQSHRYAIRVQIESPNGQLMWTSTDRYFVITHGNPDHVDVIVHPLPAAQSNAAPQARTT